MGAIHRIVTPKASGFFKSRATSAFFAICYDAIAVVWKGSKMKIGRSIEGLVPRPRGEPLSPHRQFARSQLFFLNAFKQRAEIDFTEALIALALNELKENGADDCL